MTCFDVLPAELQLQVFNYLRAPDIKAARAVSRKCRDNATPALFRSVVACARYQALGAFQNISLHSVYSNYVKEVVFDGSVYEATLAKLEQAYFTEQDRIEGLRGGSHWMRRGRWKRYQTLFQEQEDMQASGVLLQSLVRALEWMPNVSSIVYSPHPHLIPVERKDMRDLLPRSTYGLSRWRDHGYTLAHHPFRQLIGAVYMSNYIGIREFKIEAVREGEPSTEFALSIFDFPKANDMNAALHLFKHLLRLELNMAIPDVHDFGSRGVEKLAYLAKLLVAAKDLRHLAFHITHWQSTASHMYGHIFPDGRPIFGYFGLRTTWPKLRSLSLEGIYADEKDYADMITRHKDTLRSLAFRACSLFSGLWAEIVDEVVFNSMIIAFALDRVNEVDLPGDIWRYEGHLVVSKDGERSFTDTNSNKRSVYESRR